MWHKWMRRKWILAAVGLPLLVALWWAFRPEKLWINQKVNEPSPLAAAGDPQPVLTGRFESKAQETSGRATIYEQSGRAAYLRLSDLTTPNGEALHVEVQRDDGHKTDLGPLKSNTGDQSYDLPSATDVTKYSAADIYSEPSHILLAVAKLEPF